MFPCEHICVLMSLELPDSISTESQVPVIFGCDLWPEFKYIPQGRGHESIHPKFLAHPKQLSSTGSIRVRYLTSDSWSMVPSEICTDDDPKLYYKFTASEWLTVVLMYVYFCGASFVQFWNCRVKLIYFSRLDNSSSTSVSECCHLCSYLHDSKIQYKKLGWI